MVTPDEHQPPGNSIEELDYAYQFPFVGIEMDSQVTKDGVAVLMHDEQLEHTTDGHGMVSDTNLSDLAGLSLGTWKGKAVRVRTLADAMRENGDRGYFLIDAKSAEKTPLAYVNAVRESGIDPEKVMASVYTGEAGAAIKKAIPQAQVFLKYYAIDGKAGSDLIFEAQKAGLDGVMVQMEAAQPYQEFVDEAHAKGLKVVLFVMYGKSPLWALQSMFDFGVDYVLTMRPDYLASIHK